MENDEMMFFQGDSGGYLEGLIRSLPLLKEEAVLLDKLKLVIGLELDLAIMGAEKAKSEILKANATSKVRPIK